MKALYLFLLVTVSLRAETLVQTINYSQTALDKMKAFFQLPFAPGFKPQLQVFISSNDPNVSGYRVTLHTAAGTRTLLCDSYRSSGFVAFEADITGEYRVTTETLHTVATTETKQ